MRGLAIFLFCVIIIHMKELTPKIIKTYKTAFEAQNLKIRFYSEQ